MTEKVTIITYNDVLEMVERISESVPRSFKVCVPPYLLERAKKEYPNVEWVPTYEEII